MQLHRFFGVIRRCSASLQIDRSRGRDVVENEAAKTFFATVARGVQPASVRQSNQRAILTVISLEPGCSNADIARRTGLAPQTVAAVLDDLEIAGLLKRGAARRGGGRGQPATPIYINPDGAYAIGAEIG